MQKLIILAGLTILGASPSARDQLPVPGNTMATSLDAAQDKKTKIKEKTVAADQNTAEAIMDRFIEVLGGVEALKKIKNTVAKGFMDMGIMGLSASITTYTAEPNLVLVEMNVPGLGKMLSGCDGEIFWSISPISGPEIQDGKEAEEALLSAEFHDYDWRAKYTNVKLEGMETVEGEECHKIIATPRVGSPRTQYYSRITGLLVRVDGTTNNYIGQWSDQNLMADYRKIDGVMVPFKLTQRSSAGEEMTMTFTEVKNNVDLSKSTFDPPAEIKALQGGTEVKNNVGLSNSTFDPPAEDKALQGGVEADLNTAEAIMDRYIEVSGGVEAMKKIKNTTKKGNMDYMGLTTSVTTTNADPNQMLVELNVPGIGKFISGCDGNIVWRLNQITGPMIESGKEAEEQLHRANFHEYNWRARFTSVVLEGMETVEGEACYKVLATPKNGYPSTRYFSRSTGLLVRVDSTRQTEIGEQPSQDIMANYRKIDGVMFPFKITQRTNGQEATFTFTEIKNNVDLPKSTFDPPAEVIALQVR